ncbi:MAG: protein kinase [Myxococcaceae bacterium]|nr:protein kinase [Myxococcaceae bacterium]
MSLPESGQFGKYQLLRRLAVGGMAEVFLARQQGIAGFEKLLVIKRILSEYSTDPEFVSMFLDEARLAAGMAHPNVVQIFDLGQLDGSYFLAMEYVPGPDLLTILRAHGRQGQRVPFHLGARIMASVADALAYAHDHRDSRGKPLKLVHRDVTPSNILVAYAGTTKLVDFGIAKAESQSSKTAAGRVKGKTRYLAPEQLLQKPITGRTDLWAAGVCLYELVTGVRPITGDNELAMMKSILDLEIPRPRSLSPDVPEALDDIVMKCLVRDPDQRMSSAQELRHQLEVYLKSVPEPSSPADVGTYLQEHFRTEYEALEQSLAELADRRSIDTSAVAKMPSMGLDVTPSGTTGVGRKKSVEEPTNAGVAPEGVRRSKTALVVGAALAAVALVGGLGFALKGSPTGSIQVTTQPPGARVAIDGAPWWQPSPAQVKPLPFGRHTVEATLDGYEPATTEVTLDADQAAGAVALVLTPRPAVAPAPTLAVTATLSITTSPPAEVLKVDGKPVAHEGGRATVPLPPGPHTVEAEKAGRSPASSPVTLEAGATKTVTLTLAEAPGPSSPPADPKPGPTKAKRGGSLDLDTTPPTEVSLGAQKLGKTPLKAVKLPAGEVTLTFDNDALGLHTTARVSVGADGTTSKSLTFSQGKLAFDIQPWADVYLGSKKLGTTPFAPKSLYEGSYTLKLVNAELGALHNLTATVKPGETTVVRFDMTTAK